MINHIFVYYANCFRYATHSILRNKNSENDDGGQKSAWNIATPLPNRCKIRLKQSITGKKTLLKARAK